MNTLDLPVGTVVGRFAAVDDAVGAEPLTGMQVTFRPATDHLKLSSPPLFLLLNSAVCSVDADGQLLGPGLVPGVRLLVAGSPYRASFAADGRTVFDSVTVAVVAGGTVDLAAVMAAAVAG